MTALELIMEEYPEQEFLYPTGFESAIIGLDINSFCLIMDATKILDLLVQRDGMDEEEAIEYFEYNISCAYVGEKTPIYAHVYI